MTIKDSRGGLFDKQAKHIDFASQLGLLVVS